jgi:putative cell wall-binding protein
VSKFAGDQPKAGITNLPSTVTDEAFTVSWQGADRVATVVAYDVQVSTDGGPFVDWLRGTNASQATFVGTSGHGYAFRVRAHSSSGTIGSWDVVDVYATPSGLAVGGFARVTAAGAGVNVRWSPDTSSSSNILAQATAGSVGRIIGGPVRADDYTWYQLIWPLKSWGVVGDGAFVGVWMAAAALDGTDWLTPALAPNATQVAARITGLAFAGQGPASLGSAGASWREVTPNGNGLHDTLEIDWSNGLAFSAMTLQVYRSDGTLAGSIALGSRAAGAQHYTWDGRLGGVALPPATYAVRITATSGGVTYNLPSADPVDAAQLARFGVAVHTVDLSRIGGQDRYATAAAVATKFAAGSHPTVYVANGSAFPDALSGAAAAAHRDGPLLLVTATSVPAATASALARLQPARIVVLGGSAVIPDAVLGELAKTAPTTRLGGRDRYDTAARVSAEAFAPGVPAVYLVNGYDIPDALTGGAAAGRDGGPVLLTAAGALPTSTRQELLRLRPARVVILGGTTVFSAALQASVAALGPCSVVRYGGRDRYATALLIAATYGHAANVLVDRGDDFPDGLAASALGQPIVLVPPGSLPASIPAAVAALRPTLLTGLGGTTVMPQTTLSALRAKVED